MSDIVLARARAAEALQLEEQHMSGTETPGGTPGESVANPPAQPGQGGQPGQFSPTGQPGQFGQPGQYPPPPAGAGPYPPQGTPPGTPPGAAPGTPPGPWAYGQPSAGGPPGSSGNNKVLWIVLGIIAAVVALVVLLAVVLVAASNGDDKGGTGGGKAESQSAAVKAYLSAIAEGDAEKALSLAAVEPLDTDFLTDDVLAESAKTAEITDIKVGEVANEFVSSVPATFKIGDQTVTEQFQVVKSGDEWKMNEVGSMMDFTSMRSNTLPMLLNGEAFDVDKVTLFPGAYTLSTGTDTIAYGTGQFTVKGSADYLSGTDLTPTLTPEGEKAFVDAVKASARACLQKQELSPANCPNKADNGGAYKLDKSTTKWTQRGGTNPFANLKPRLDYESPNIAEVRPSLQLRVRADCNSPSGRCELITYSYKDATANMVKEPLVIRWVD